MKKSAKEWFAHLPEPIRSQAVANSNNLNMDYSTLAECLFKNFIWIDTPQGDDYWCETHNRADAGEFDQAEPNQHGWISVSDRLPTAEDGDERGDVLVLDKNGLKSIGSPKWVKINKDWIQFWQPLPKLPEVKGGDAV
jgi:hypothetical protein